jgi:hypothetical protein
MTEQTTRDRAEHQRRAAGLEPRIGELRAQLRRIVRSQKLKETLIKVAEHKAKRKEGPELPRLERRNLDLLVLWIARYHGGLLECDSVDEFLFPGTGLWEGGEGEWGDRGNEPFEYPDFDEF